MPVTPYTPKSRLAGSDVQLAPGVPYAGITGLKPKVIRSNGVKKWRRFAGGSERGPSGGSFASEAAFVALATLVTPSSLRVNW